MRVLIACESSGTVRREFCALGNDAWSCDLLPSDDRSDRHYTDDCLRVMCDDGPWDLVIAHPPCTHLASAGAKHFAKKRADGRQQCGIDFFMSVVHECEGNARSWAIENPIGIMSGVYRSPDQIIQPYWFGDEARKSTCLWLQNLPKLTPTKMVGHGEIHVTSGGKRIPKWYNIPPSNPDRWKIRSKTFREIAEAMAMQWSKSP